MFLTAIAASAEECPVYRWQVDRTKPLQASNGTLASRMNSSPEEKKLVEHILEHYENLGQRRSQGNTKGELRECFARPALENIRVSAGALVKQYGFGDIYDCLTVLDDGGRKIPTYRTSLDLFKLIVKFNDIVLAHAPEVLRSYGLPWGKETIYQSEMLGGLSPAGYRKCSLAKSLAYRVNGSWTLASMFTNVSKDISAKKFERGYFSEALTVNEYQKVVPVPLRMPTCKTVDEEKKKMNLTGYESGTAYLASWAGRPTWTHFQMRELWYNPALEAALFRGQHEKELVQDSDTASNLAILFLPAALALVPLGLFQDVSISVTLLYILATDVVSVLPVAIKGIELLVYSSKVHTATASYLYGARTATDLAAAETWVANCWMTPRIRNEGIAILFTAIAVMLFGILLEVLTTSKIRRLRITNKMSLQELETPDFSDSGSSGGLLWLIEQEKRDNHLRTAYY